MFGSASRGLALAALALGLAAPPVAAQPSGLVAAPGPNPQWVEVNQTEDGRGYVDRGSVRHENGKVRFLGRILYIGENEHGLVEVFHLGEIDCAARTFRAVGFDAFGAAGRLIVSHINTPEEGPAEPIGAGSPNEALHAEHCH